MFCKTCEDGDEPAVLDIDGVLSSVSGTPGCWGHSYEDDWWPCERKAAEEHAIVIKLPVTKDGVRVIAHEHPTVFVFTRQLGLYRPGEKADWREMVVDSFDGERLSGMVAGSHRASFLPEECFSTVQAAQAAEPKASTE